MRKTILLATLFFSYDVVYAQQKGAVQGTVTDKQTSELLIGASVVVKGSAASMLTDGKGAFKLSAIDAGQYILLISYVGYETLEWPVLVQEGQIVKVNVSLSLDNRPGNEVVVSASRRPEKVTHAPAPIQIISAKDIAHFAGSNVGELVARVPGVEYTRSGVDEITFNARGLHSAFNNRVFQMVDGRNTMAAASGSLPLFNNGSTPKDDLERIEIITGPQTALYGPNAHNALFNYITKDPRRYTGTTVSVSAGSQAQFSSRFRHAGIINQKWAFKITGEHATGEDYEWYDTVYAGRPTAPVAIPEKIQDFSFKRIRSEAHLYYKVLPNADIIVSGGGSQFTRLQVTTGGRNQLGDVTYGFVQARLVHPRLFATLYNTWGNMGSSINIANYTRDFYNFTRPGPDQRTPEEAERLATRLGNRFKEKSQRLNAELQYNYSFTQAGLFVVGGASYQKEKPNGFGINLVDSFERIEVTQYGAVLQAEKSLPWKLRLVGAIRADHHSNFGNFVAPRLAMVKGVQDGSIRVTWGRAYSMPSILNQYTGINRLLFGNGGKGISYIPVGASVKESGVILNTIPLKPEQVSTWEVGYRGRLNQKLFVDVNYHNGLSKNFISPTITVLGQVQQVNGIPVTHNPQFAGQVVNDTLRNASFLTFFNYGDVKIQGVDAALNYAFNKWVSFSVKYSWLHSNITQKNKKNDANGDGFISPEETSLNAPRHRGMVSLDMADLMKGKLYVSIAARFVEQYDFYSGSQIGTAAGKGRRGVIQRPNNLPPLLKNFDWGPLGGFTTIDLQLGYQITSQSQVNLGVTNLLNTRQIEFTGAPSIGRLLMAELKVHLPQKEKALKD